MLESKKITLGFSLIIVVVFCLGLNFQWQLSKLSQDNNDLYDHPFAVSNAELEAKLIKEAFPMPVIPDNFEE